MDLAFRLGSGECCFGFISSLLRYFRSSSNKFSSSRRPSEFCSFVDMLNIALRSAASRIFRVLCEIASDFSRNVLESMPSSSEIESDRESQKNTQLLARTFWFNLRFNQMQLTRSIELLHNKRDNDDCFCLWNFDANSIGEFLHSLHYLWVNPNFSIIRSTNMYCKRIQRKNGTQNKQQWHDSACKVLDSSHLKYFCWLHGNWNIFLHRWLKDNDKMNIQRKIYSILLQSIVNFVVTIKFFVTISI